MMQTKSGGQGQAIGRATSRQSAIKASLAGKVPSNGRRPTEEQIKIGYKTVTLSKRDAIAIANLLLAVRSSLPSTRAVDEAIDLLTGRQ